MSIPNKNPGDTLLASELNALFKGVGKLSHITASSGIQVSNTMAGIHISLTTPMLRWWFGIVVEPPDGSDPFSDSRYFVERAKMANDNSDAADAVLEFAAETGEGNPLKKTVVATNLNELLAASHMLPVGTPVVVYEHFDMGAPPTKRYYFQSGGTGIRFAKITAVSAYHTYRWSYTGSEVEMDTGDGNWKLKVGGAVDLPLTNTIEANNPSGGGMMGTGQNSNDFLEGVSLLPIGVGAVVPFWTILNCDDVIQHVFSQTNAVKIACV